MVRWFDTPHLPHAWECGFLAEERSATLLCGDLFTQGGTDLPPLTGSDMWISEKIAKDPRISDGKGATYIYRHGRPRK